MNFELDGAEVSPRLPGLMASGRGWLYQVELILRIESLLASGEAGYGVGSELDSIAPNPIVDRRMQDSARVRCHQELPNAAFLIMLLSLFHGLQLNGPALPAPGVSCCGIAPVHNIPRLSPLYSPSILPLFSFYSPSIYTLYISPRWPQPIDRFWSTQNPSKNRPS